MLEGGGRYGRRWWEVVTRPAKGAYNVHYNKGISMKGMIGSSCVVRRQAYARKTDLTSVNGCMES